MAKRLKSPASIASDLLTPPSSKKGRPCRASRGSAADVEEDDATSVAMQSEAPQIELKDPSMLCVGCYRGVNSFSYFSKGKP